MLNDLFPSVFYVKMSLTLVIYRVTVDYTSHWPRSARLLSVSHACQHSVSDRPAAFKLHPASKSTASTISDDAQSVHCKKIIYFLTRVNYSRITSASVHQDSAVRWCDGIWRGFFWRAWQISDVPGWVKQNFLLHYWRGHFLNHAVSAACSTGEIDGQVLLEEKYFHRFIFFLPPSFSSRAICQLRQVTLQMTLHQTKAG